MYRVLLLTDAIQLKSGLARCGREVAARFHNHPEFEILQAGWHHMGLPHEFPLQIFPVMKQAPDEPERLYQIIAQTHPHFILAIGDPFYFGYLRELKQKIAKHLKHRCDWIGWITIDGDPLQAEQFRLLLPFDKLFLMSKFAEKQVRDGIDRYRVKNPAMMKMLKPEDEALALTYEAEVNRLHAFTETLYPGVDMQQFHPQPSSWHHPKLGPMHRGNKFVVLTVDQNTSRKAVGTVIDAYAEFAKGKEDVFLYLATDAHDPHGTNLMELLGYHGLTEDHYFIQQNSPVAGITDNDLTNIYNMATVLFSCTSGEGFKLPILEAMASRCLTIMPSYTTGQELLEENRGILIPSGEGYWYGTHNYRKVVIPRVDAVAALEKAYHLWKAAKGDPTCATAKKLTGMLDRSMNFAMAYNWDRTSKTIMDGMLGIYDRTPEVQVA